MMLIMSQALCCSYNSNYAQHTWQLQSWRDKPWDTVMSWHRCTWSKCLQWITKQHNVVSGLTLSLNKVYMLARTPQLQCLRLTHTLLQTLLTANYRMTDTMKRAQFHKPHWKQCRLYHEECTHRKSRASPLHQSPWKAETSVAVVMTRRTMLTNWRKLISRFSK